MLQLTTREAKFFNRAVEVLGLCDWTIGIYPIPKGAGPMFGGCNVTGAREAYICLRSAYKTFADFKGTVIHELLHVRLGHRVMKQYKADKKFAKDIELTIEFVELALRNAL